MPNTDNLVTVLLALKSTLEDASEELGLQDVWYGDQEMIPRVPCVALEPEGKTRTMAGVPLQTLNEFRVYLYVYHGGIQDTQITTQACDERAEAIEAALHTDVTLGGVVVHGFVTQSEPGVFKKGNALMAATRLTWEGITKTRVGA